jgi:hypothetical protein
VGQNTRHSAPTALYDFHQKINIFSNPVIPSNTVNKKNFISCILSFCLSSLLVHAVEVAGFTFTPPSEWKSSTPTSSMRKAQFEATSSTNEKAEVTFFHFGSTGAGGIQANVDRWMKQFEDPQGKEVKTEKIGNVSVTFAQAHGTFLSGRPFGAKTPKPGYALTAAIIDGAMGSIFIKMTGPQKAVDENTEALKKMVLDSVNK